MKLDIKDRYIIINQLKILEALYPDEASSYAIHRTAFEAGYEAHYSWAMDFVYEDTLTKDLTDEVVNTLDMFRAISFYIRDKKDIENLNPYRLKFSGYDGNDNLESSLMGYARYFVVELNRFQEILEQDEFFDFNSHMEMRDIYLNMLEKWLKLKPGRKEGERHNLTRSQIEAIVGLE